jgi:hypothetical protein
VVVDDLPGHLRELLAEHPGVDRSGQLFHLAAASVELGAADGHVAWLARRFAPALAKYGDRLDGEVARLLAKLRRDHPHPGTPCDRAGCAHTPRPQGGPAVSTPDDGPHLAVVPPYPTREVGGPVAALVEATPGLPPALVGAAALGALAHLAAPATLHIHGTWTERPILWLPLLGPPSIGKSPALDRAWAPLADHDYLAARTVDDFTIELLARRLDETGGVGAMVIDELAGKLAAFGRYHKSGGTFERARFLALWTGARWTYARVTAKVNITVAAPVVTVTGCLVTHNHRLLGRVDDGMRPRWLPHLAERVAPRLDPLDDGGWPFVVDDLAMRPRPRTWHLDAHTRGGWEAARARWRALAGGDAPDSVREAAGKADRHAARVALTLAEGIAPGTGGAIPPEAMTGAIALVDYTLDVWRALPEGEVLTLSRRMEAVDGAVDRWAAWLEHRPDKQATRGTLLRYKVGGVQTAKEVDIVLDRYEERFPGTVEHNTVPAGGGPPATIVHAPRRG